MTCHFDLTDATFSLRRSTEVEKCIPFACPVQSVAALRESLWPRLLTYRQTGTSHTGKEKLALIMLAHNK